MSTVRHISDQTLWFHNTMFCNGFRERWFRRVRVQVPRRIKCVGRVPDTAQASTETPNRHDNIYRTVQFLRASRTRGQNKPNSKVDNNKLVRRNPGGFGVDWGITECRRTWALIGQHQTNVFLGVVSGLNFFFFPRIGKSRGPRPVVVGGSCL